MTHKFGRALRAFGEIARDPRLLNRVLDDDRVLRREVGRRHGLPAGLPVAPFEEVVRGGCEAVRPFAFLDGGSLPTDHALLRGLARQAPGCRYFEIGTWRGESVANVAAVAAECFTLCLPDDEMRRRGWSESFIAQHEHFSRGLANVRHLRCDSGAFDFSAHGKFDLVFIDGDHHHPSVRADTANVFRHMLHDRSVVVWHDYGYSPEVVRWEVLLGILDGVPRDLHRHLFHVANTKSAVFTRMPVAARALGDPETPTIAFDVQMSWRPAEVKAR